MATILVVDDSPVITRTIGFVLRQHGFHVLEAANGRHALRLMEETPVDLVIADVTMPVMDGWALLEHLRTHDAWRTLPVIMLTASNAEFDRERAIQAGANGYLTKPVSSWRLIEIIEQTLSSSEKAEHEEEASDVIASPRT